MWLLWQFGPTATYAIVGGTGPGFISTFIIAVQRFNAEREEDDARLKAEEEEERARRRGVDRQRAEELAKIRAAEGEQASEDQ
jgi:hypothetical protein